MKNTIVIKGADFSQVSIEKLQMDGGTLVNPFKLNNYNYMLRSSTGSKIDRAWWFLECTSAVVQVIGVPSGYKWTINGFDSLEHAINTTPESYYTPTHAWKSDDGTYYIENWAPMAFLRFNMMKGNNETLNNTLVQNFLNAVTITITYTT